jgi:hypothetical protein
VGAAILVNLVLDIFDRIKLLIDIQPKLRSINFSHNQKVINALPTYFAAKMPKIKLDG